MSSRPDSRRVLEVAAIALVAVVALCGYWFAAVAGHQPPSDDGSGKPISTMYDPPRNDVERALVRGDGQLYAALATDPAVRHPGIVTGPPTEEAYRYQRPGYGWLAWIASAGRRDAVEWALIALTSLSVVGLVAVTARWLIDRDQDPRFALLLLVAPGVLVNLLWIGPEAFGTLLVMVALAAARSPRWIDATAVGGARRVRVSAAAGLCRESVAAGARDARGAVPGPAPVADRAHPVGHRVAVRGVGVGAAGPNRGVARRFGPRTACARSRSWGWSVG